MIQPGIFTRDVTASDTRGRDEWETPPALFEAIARKLGGFDLDVCATPETAKCKAFFPPAEDGLSQPWAPLRCWCNPPYSHQAEWTLKAAQEARRGASVCLLVPPKTETNSWHQTVMQQATAIVVLKGRVSFHVGGSLKSGNTYGSALVIFDPERRWSLEGFEPGPRLLGWDWKASLRSKR